MPTELFLNMCDSYINEPKSNHIFPKSKAQKSPAEKSTAHILIKNFITTNSNWTIDAATNYCLSEYKKFGANSQIFSDALKDYIDSRPQR